MVLPKCRHRVDGTRVDVLSRCARERKRSSAHTVGIRAFVTSGHESIVMKRLLGATSGTIHRANNPKVVSLVGRIEKGAPVDAPRNGFHHTAP